MHRGRGYFGKPSRGRGRGQWRGNGTLRDNSSRPTVSLSPSPPFGDLLEVVTHESLTAEQCGSVEAPEITDCHYVASYNWLKSGKPLVVVPGAPPQWEPLDKPEKLPEDAGEFFRDINAAHYPKHPIEPAVRAVFAQRPSLATNEVDVFACGSTLGNLLRFARKSDKSFRFVVEVAGETVFLTRREKATDERIMDIRGHGHTFPDTYTRLAPCVAESDSHQRLIEYKFAGFQCIVRYEVDGYLPELANDDSRPASGLRLPNLAGLTMVSGGAIVPQAAIFDLKTRSVRKHLTFDDVLGGEVDRLWLRQIPNFILAYHDLGVFNEVGVHDVRAETAKYQTEHSTELKMLAAAVAKVVAYARQNPGRRFEVCSEEPGVLELRYVGGVFPYALPADLKSVWAGEGAVSGDEGSDIAIGSDAESGAELESDDDSEQDFTACSEGCGYCGRCSR